MVASAAPSSSKPYVVPRAVQQERDSDRKRILQNELAREQDKLQTLTQTLSKARSQDAGPDVERLSQAVRRAESDIESISRELALASRY
jgi:bacterioferritin (cytochrome b1)